MTTPSLTPARHTALARLSDGDWRYGHQIAASGKVLANLERDGLIRHDFDIHARMDRLYTITVDGLEALEALEASA